MKGTKRFAALFAAAIIFFTSISAAAAAVSLQGVKQKSNQELIGMMAAVREKYPEVTASEIVELLNGNTDEKNARQELSVFGIDDGAWVSLSVRESSVAVVAAGAVLTALSGAVLLVLFLIYSRLQRREAAELAAYLSQINRGKYDLKIDENTEDSTSVLRNEIYKTTVMLRGQSENSKRDKELLKDSLSDISHQLKTPLTSILIMVDNLIENEDMPKELRREFLSDINRSANNISFLVQTLLTLSKLDANSIELKSMPENTDKIFDECIQNTAVLAELKGVSVFAEQKDITISCDFHWLVEAISNIVKNCIEHTPKGGEVRLSASDNKLYTKITVSDNGSGIAKKDLPHVFERFYKGRNSDDDSIGIGLALAKTVIEKNGGYITVYSAEGKGTVFTIKYFKRLS